MESGGLKKILVKHLEWLRDERGGVRADLSSADLSGAVLCGAKGIDIQKSAPDLYLLKSQPPNTKLIAYKFLNFDYTSPYKNFQYELGEEYEFEGDTDELQECGAGGNVATLAWCLRNKQNAEQIMVEVSFKAKDICAIPFATDGKFRVNKFKIEREWEPK